MATFDETKLHRILEQARTLRLQVSDASERAREAKSRESYFRGIILREFDMRGMRVPAEVHDLLDADADVIMAMPHEAIAGHRVNPETLRDCVYWRQEHRRLAAMLDDLSDRSSSAIACCDRLCDAVKSWGFADPRML